ncbi:MAG TPA: type I methionyl aminopeptidase [Gemmataceae bacterium]|nr:type I methionyl aminopeptidase [Gemmataceae bacterium]
MLKSFFSPRPELKSPRELALMREAGKLVAEALRLCRAMVKPGTKTVEIDQAVEALYHRHGAVPLFKGYPGRVPFPAVTCISLNEQVVHGIPGQRVLREGDLLKLDTACKLNGWCADAAITVPVGEVTPEKRRLIDVAEQVLRTATVEMARRKWWSEVATAMQRVAESAGFSVVTQYVGHGIGRTMHENPQVANFFSCWSCPQCRATYHLPGKAPRVPGVCDRDGKPLMPQANRETRKSDFPLEEGLVLAVEPMVNMGRPDTDTQRDHWTVVTRDGLPSAHVEHTLALTRDGVYVVTADEETVVPRQP